MAITQIINPAGDISYSVYINLRSKTMPHIRHQKRITGLKTKAEALRKEKTLIKDLSIKVAHHEGHGFTWRMIVNQWAASAPTESNSTGKSYNPSVITDYVAMMNNWTSDWLDRPAAEISRGEGKEVLDRVIEEGRSKAFQKKLKNTINMIFNWGIEERFIRGVQQSPVHGFKIVLKQDKKPEILKIDEIKKLLNEAKSQKHEWYYVWSMALLTGMRNGELYALEWRDVDFENKIIKVEKSYNFKNKEIKETKAGYWRNVPISLELERVLLEIKSENSLGYILPRIAMWKDGSQAKVLKTFCNLIGIPKIKFHTLRSCFATQLIGLGVEPVKVMKVCGWKDLKTLSIYLRLLGIDEKGCTDKLILY